jgi:DNA-binding transcriptional LysR family regulator
VLNETKIKCFLALADTLNFTETAKMLYMTQQAVSKHIARLEEDFGFPLFLRSKRSVTLTQEGEQCYKLFSTFYPKYERFLAEGRARYAHTKQTIRIGYQNWLDLGPAPGRALNALRKTYSDIELSGERYSPGALYERLAAGKLDLIIILDSYVPDMTGFLALPLVKTKLVLMVSPEHPKAKDGGTYRSFIHEPLLLDSFEHESPAETYRRAQKKIQQHGLEPEQVIVVPNRDSVYTATELGQGIAIGAEMSQFVRGGTVKIYPVGA